MDLLDYIRLKLGGYMVIRKVLDPINQRIRKMKTRRMNVLYKKYGNEAFDSFCNILISHKIHFWPEFGTLLGIYRENGFIKHDYDYDFGAFQEDSELIQKILENGGFKLKHSYRCEDIPEIKEDTYEFKGVAIDLFFFVKGNEHDICYTFIPGKIESFGKISYKIKYFTFGKVILKNVKFRNIDITIPADTSAHLAVSYGPNFMTPDPSFKSINHSFIEGKYGTLTSY